ncbi:hypothetical protein GCM10027594_28590 [Hymenobacter agri]
MGGAGEPGFAGPSRSPDVTTAGATAPPLRPVNFKGFARRSFGTPELAFQAGEITLKSAPYW